VGGSRRTRREPTLPRVEHADSTQKDRQDRELWPLAVRRRSSPLHHRAAPGWIKKLQKREMISPLESASKRHIFMKKLFSPLASAIVWLKDGSSNHRPGIYFGGARPFRKPASNDGFLRWVCGHTFWGVRFTLPPNFPQQMPCWCAIQWGVTVRPTFRW